jgi:hypothetical protein
MKVVTQFHARRRVVRVARGGQYQDDSPRFARSYGVPQPYYGFRVVRTVRID